MGDIQTLLKYLSTEKGDEEMKTYCSLCGNQLDPKIHYKPGEFGKTSREMAKLQKRLLRELLKSIYFVAPNIPEGVYFESIIEMLKK